MKTLLAIALLALLAFPTFAAPLDVTTTPTSANVKRGEPVTVSATLSNSLTARPPITLTATIDYVDAYGKAQTAEASTTLAIKQAVKVSNYRVTLPSLCSFVVGSGRVNDNGPLTVMELAGVLTIILNRELAEQQAITISYEVMAL